MKVDTSKPWAKRFINKEHRLVLKRKDLPHCPYCKSEAFLQHDLIGLKQSQNLIAQFPEGSMERRAFEAWVKNQVAAGEERFDFGYTCGCKAYRPGDGIHPEPMAKGILTRYSAIMWWLRKVDEIEARAKNGKQNSN